VDLEALPELLPLAFPAKEVIGIVIAIASLVNVQVLGQNVTKDRI
jgi:hypothetical protein